MKLRVFDMIAIPPPKKKKLSESQKILFLFNFADFFFLTLKQTKLNEWSRGAKVGGVGGVATPPEFWKGGLILKRELFLHKFLKSRPSLIALRRIAKKWSFLMRKNS